MSLSCTLIGAHSLNFAGKALAEFHRNRQQSAAPAIVNPR
jgi:hypothetical protein